MQRRIIANDASSELVRLYCFCRQVRTLYLMGDFPQLIERAIAFIESFFRSLQQTSQSLDWFQPYQWAVGACLEIAYACELSWNGQDYQNTAASGAATHVITPELMSRHLGDILYLARRVLRSFMKTYCAIGSPRLTQLQHSPVVAVASTAVEYASDGPWYESLGQILASALASGDHVDRCLWEMSHLASLHFSRAGRHRFAVFLGGECARYHARHHEYESASRLQRSHARQCEEDKWYPLMADCVRRICDAELRLGRAAQAVAACFSMLDSAQEAKAEVGRAFLAELMDSIVQGVHAQGPRREETTPCTTKMNMGELIQAAVCVETMQTARSNDLDQGEIRVTLTVGNRFPAGIHMDKLRVRFARLKEREQGASPQAEVCSDPSVSDGGHASSDSAHALPRLHSLVLDDGAATTSDVVQLTTSPTKSSAQEDDMSDISIDDQLERLAPALAVTVAGATASDVSGRERDEFVLEEMNVYLYEKASVNLVFLHRDVDVGAYICSGVECVLAGSAFPLLSGPALTKIEFAIPRRESTVQLLVAGPPLITPRENYEQCVHVCVASNKDTVADGTLELSVARNDDDGQSLDSEPGLVQLTKVTILGDENDCEAFPVEIKDDETLLMRIPKLASAKVLRLALWFVVHESQDEEEASEVTFVTAFRYQHVTASDWNVGVRRAELSVRAAAPMTAQTRLKRIGGDEEDRALAAITLTCNGDIGVVLRDYTVDTPAVEGVRLLQDPNGHVRNQLIRPHEKMHLAFTFSSVDQAKISGLSVRVTLEYESDALVGSAWQTELVVQIPLQRLHGPRYRIDVQPVDNQKTAMTGEYVTFHVRVQEFDDYQLRPEDEHEDERVLLCLDDASESDWILVGRQKELFAFQQHDDLSPSTSSSRSFSTHKQALATRVGRLRFPRFTLRSLSGQQTPSERLARPYSACQILIT